MPKNDAPITQSIGFTVANMARSLGFYTRVLPFTQISDQTVAGTSLEQLTGLEQASTRVVQLQLGDEMIELTEYSPPGKPIPTDTRSNDRWFQHVAIVVSDMDKAYRTLQSQIRPVSTEPQTLPEWNEDMAGIRAFYFQDPDGHFLELIQFPSNKGQAKWHQPTDDLFLGIDHTAIVVQDTEASLRFYQEVAGLELAQVMENYGPEHEHLSRVSNLHIKVTRLNPTHGIGVELLEYLSPQDGRPMPDDIRANDIMHGQITVIVEDAIALAKQSLARPVSGGVDALPAAAQQFDRGVYVRDPDGHAVRLVEA